MLSEDKKLQIKMSMNDKWQLVKLTQVWPDGHLINQMAHALIERNAELLSLREQLAELKALEPVAWMDDNGNVCTVDNRLRGLTAECADAYRKYNIPLFTAAKPAEIPRHIYSMLVNELRDVPAIGCKRELIIGVLNRHGVTAEPVQFDPPAAK
ncbi:polyphosphate kinase [Yersinia enterocolitica]|uniref:polyphosphate kinase n=1 Tax=Yersinia enterocolitica TaxID=630 RepID=UPI003F471A4A